MKINTLLYTSSILIFLTACGGSGGSSTRISFLTDPTQTSTPEDPKQSTESLAIPQTITLFENTAHAIILQGSGSLFVVESDPSHGTLEGTAPALTYTPDKDYHGLDSFEFSVDGSALATVSLIITEVNDRNISQGDLDNDFIPNEIEVYLGFNPNDPDENNNGIADGLETEGTRGDAFFKYQWHLKSDGTFTNNSDEPSIEGNDLALLPVYHTYMGYNNGNRIIVQVVDTGVDADHPDLVGNMDLTRSLDAEVQGDPSANPFTLGYTHGTQVAGIMAARAFNTIGVRGIIPFAQIAGSNWLDTQSNLGLEKAWLTGSGANEIAVSNNSWGSYFDTDTLYEDLMEEGTSTLRDGKGRIYTFAGGNDRETFGNTNFTYTLSNRFAFAVAGIQHDNTFAEYSSQGANLLISGYSGNFIDDSPTIGTTTVAGEAASLTWSEDTKKDYTFAMNGTSAASPMVAASLALVLEACPGLTWRDVKYLTAKHAIQVDETNPTWVTNNAGHSHSIDYGFGLVNPAAMIEACHAGYVNLGTERNDSVTTVFNKPIADQSAETFSLTMSSDMTVEWVEVTIDNDSPYASDYDIELISPSGTATKLMSAFENGSIVDFNIGSRNWLSGGFRLSAAAMLGESSLGVWKIVMTDKFQADEGSVKNITLKVYGH